MQINLPKNWNEVNKKDFIRLAGILKNPKPDIDFRMMAFLVLSKMRPVRKAPVNIDGFQHFWFRHDRKNILVGANQLASAADSVGFLLKDKHVPVPDWRGSRTWFRPPVFGLYTTTVHQYLNCENHFAAYFATGQSVHLEKLALNLWLPKKFAINPGKKILSAGPDVASAICLFYAGCRFFLHEQFPKIFKEGSESGSDVTQLIRILNGGDVTRNEAILKCQLWDALKQLNDMAKSEKQSL